MSAAGCNPVSTKSRKTAIFENENLRENHRLWVSCRLLTMLGDHPLQVRIQEVRSALVLTVGRT